MKCILLPSFFSFLQFYCGFLVDLCLAVLCTQLFNLKFVDADCHLESQAVMFSILSDLPQSLSVVSLLQ